MLLTRVCGIAFGAAVLAALIRGGETRRKVRRTRLTANERDTVTSALHNAQRMDQSIQDWILRECEIGGESGELCIECGSRKYRLMLRSATCPHRIVVTDCSDNEDYDFPLDGTATRDLSEFLRNALPYFNDKIRKSLELDEVEGCRVNDSKN